MASRDEVEAFTKANRDLRKLALAELQGFWATLDKSDVDKVRRALEEFMPLLVKHYGEIAAVVAADFYDDLRSASSVRGRFAAVMAQAADDGQVQASSRWALGSLLGANPDAVAAFGSLSTVADKFVLGQGRDTIAESVRRDPARARWARIPHGDTCAFCVMLASRGAVYASEASAGTFAKFHGKCDCTPTPFWDGDPYPDHYDPDEYMRMYLDGRGKAESGRIGDVLSGMRQVDGITH